MLAVAGIVGFFYSSDFGSPGDVETVLGLLDVNGWLNTVHILAGASALIAFSAGLYAQRQCALALGAFYILLSIWGFIVGSGDSILGVIPVSTPDNVLHAVIGFAGLGAGLATAAVERAAA